MLLIVRYYSMYECISLNEATSCFTGYLCVWYPSCGNGGLGVAFCSGRCNKSWWCTDVFLWLRRSSASDSQGNGLPLQKANGYVSVYGRSTLWIVRGSILRDTKHHVQLCGIRDTCVWPPTNFINAFQTSCFLEINDSSPGNFNDILAGINHKSSNLPKVE